MILMFFVLLMVQYFQVADCQKHNSESAKLALETKLKQVEKDLKLEIHEGNQLSAKLEQDLIKEKECNQKQVLGLQKEIEGLKVEINQEDKAKTTLKITIDDLKNEKSVLNDSNKDLEKKVQDLEQKVKGRIN